VNYELMYQTCSVQRFRRLSAKWKRDDRKVIPSRGMPGKEKPPDLRETDVNDRRRVALPQTILYVPHCLEKPPLSGG
jgi:hypothetical protein